MKRDYKEKPCAICGLLIKPSNNAQKYCKPCASKRNYERAMTYGTYSKRYYGGLREVIIARDGNKCRNCDMSREEHKKRFGKDITVDHIDGKGFNSKVKNNNPDNLITLCLKCHGKKDRARLVTYTKGKVGKFNVGGELLEVFDSVREASEKSGITAGGIYCSIQQRRRGRVPITYFWEYINEPIISKRRR